MDTSAGSDQRTAGLRVLGMLILLGGGALLVFRLFSPPASSPPSPTGELHSGAPAPAGEALLLFTPVPPTPTEEPPAPTLTPTPPPVVVYISGEVLLPGVYELPTHARVNDVVMAAGGLTDKAARNHINLAAHIYDAQHIHIPRLGEPTPSAAASQGDESAPVAPVSSSPAVESPGGVLNINRATEEELKQLDGIGEVLARRIVEYRTVNGPFHTIDELQQIPHISPALVDTIRPYITVEQ